MTLSFRAVRRAVVYACAAGFLACSFMVIRVQWKYADRIQTSTTAVQEVPVALILGASVQPNGTASDALYDRVMTGVDLYKSGKVMRLFMTGDDGAFHTNEVKVMTELAESAGVPAGAILSDGHGYRTYESCKRAVQVFDIKQAVVVTQRFHLGRALYLCGTFGMDVQGMTADRHTYRSIVQFTVRDIFASVKAWLDVNLWGPKPPVG